MDVGVRAVRAASETAELVGTHRTPSCRRCRPMTARGLILTFPGGSVEKPPQLASMEYTSGTGSYTGHENTHQGSEPLLTGHGEIRARRGRLADPRFERQGDEMSYTDLFTELVRGEIELWNSLERRLLDEARVTLPTFQALSTVHTLEHPV